jgi:hypothetical protein
MMTVEHVSWEYPAGMQAFRNLTTMLGRALEIAGVPAAECRGGSGHIGHYLDDGRFWAGIMYTSPNAVILTIETMDFDRDRFGALDRGEVGDDGKPVFKLDLNTEAVHFFARTSDSQLALLTEFLRNAYRDAKSCLVVGI